MLSISELEKKSRDIRVDILKMVTEAGSGHPGGSLSATDILVTLYNNVLRHDPKNPDWEERDRFILSKGHAAPLLYAVLADQGYISQTCLPTLRDLGSILQGHPVCEKVKGVEVSTGSLGNGLSIGAGLAAAARINNAKWRVYVLLGDGECDEGTVWEGAMFAAHYRLGNLTAIIDRNGLQIDGPTEQVMGLNPLPEKWRAFNWNVIEVDGHKHKELLKAFDEAIKPQNRPSVIIANTVKGKGVSYMEGNVSYHGKVPSKPDLEKALKELGVHE